jgi:hypothetical protein
LTFSVQRSLLSFVCVMTKLIILGAGESGVGAAILAAKVGYMVFVSDAGKIAEKYKSVLVEKGIEFEEGKHSEEKILAADEVMKSPGIPDKSSLIIQIRSKGIPVISEIELMEKQPLPHWLSISVVMEVWTAHWSGISVFLLPGRWLKTRKNGISSKSAVFNWTTSRRSGPISPY